MSAPLEILFESVLLIEDDTSHAMLIKRALKNFTGKVDHAASTAQSLLKLAEHRPDLIVTDLNLPDSNPTQHIRSLVEQSKDLPIIVLTSSNALKDAVDAMKLGARDYIVKNFDENFSEALLFSLTRTHAQVLLQLERRKLQREMDVLRVAIENSNDGLAVVQSSGDILYANQAFTSFVSLCGGQGQNILSVFSEKLNKYENLRQAFAANLTNLPEGAVWNTEITFVANKDLAFDLSLSIVEAQPAAVADNKRECVAWLRDISDQKRREKFQREILSTTTHDLKGPLGAIIISSEMLQEMVKEQKKVFELVLRMGSSAHSAVNLIDEFLSARRIQEGNFILKPSNCDAVQLVETVLGDYTTIANSRGIELHTSFNQQQIPIMVDRLGFSRVVGNLLSNALKFTPRSGKVSIELLAGQEELHVKVADTGCGMEPSEVRSIFERFSRLEQHRDTAGTGIGLFVVKSIVNAHGGNIVVTSQAKHGTTFDLTWPLKPPVNERGELICLDFA